MPGDELESIPGLAENHRRVLARKAGITSLRALADADQRAVYTALATIRPRPSLARIAGWQDDARSRLADAANDRPAWQTAASFAVIFALRQVDGRWERRLEAEQTEVEPAPEPRQWAGWDCGPLWDWMHDQLGVEEDLEEDKVDAAGPAGAAVESAAVESAEPAAAAAPAPERARLRIDSVTITDARRDVDLVSAGKLVAAPPGDLRPPVRMRFIVHGGRAGQQLRAAVWFRRPDGPGWSPQDPVTVPASGQAEFDLTTVPDGGHDVRLLAWATDPGVRLAAVSLPELTFRQ
ncbi:MAG: hypothetical protein J2P27_19045 [Actinobacteria bacterium]|nr:hypothetical protein [Actinomycetota bacterium]